ncbi:helix-turn-helix domain-containing protein [Variovorax paradoxus]|uniref:helix-turn-helix domain-containing protein n=1 Tax=Variovorax paradoxus TaxID=34073 RepID=UPI003ECF4625
MAFLLPWSTENAIFAACASNGTKDIRARKIALKFPMCCLLRQQCTLFSSKGNYFMAQSGLGLLLRALREARGLSSRELGQLADIDHTYVYRLETGEKQSPSEDLLARLLRVLKADVREAEMAQWLVANDANPDWVAHTLATPDLTAEMFEMGASMRHRGGARPDMQTIEARVRKAFED